MGHLKPCIIPWNGGCLPMLVAAAVSLAACTPKLKLTVNSQVPVPVVQKLPLSVAVFYDEQLRNYVYEEHSKDRPDWQIASGASQVAMFDQVLPSMFDKVTRVDSINPILPAPVDVVISPDIKTMQFALPSETKTHVYEAWVKYEIRLLQPDGTLIADWPLTGHGKCMDGFVHGRDEGLLAAITLALRDAGAKLVLGFKQVAKVRSWLAARGQ